MFDEMLDRPRLAETSVTRQFETASGVVAKIIRWRAMSHSGRLFDPGVVSEAFSPAQLEKRASELGVTLTQEYRGRIPVMVAIMSGSVIFLADLVRHMDVEMDIEFLIVNRYQDGSNVSIVMDLFSDIGGRDVIVVIDVVSTGITLRAIHQLLEGRSPATMSTVALFDRGVSRLVDVPIDYLGFEIGRNLLVGYGLDWQGRYRGLPSVWAVLDPPALSSDPRILDRTVYTEQ